MRNMYFAVSSVVITNCSSWVTLRKKKKCGDEGCRQWGPRPPWSAEAGSVYFYPGTTGPELPARGGTGTCSKEETRVWAGALSEVESTDP